MGDLLNAAYEFGGAKLVDRLYSSIGIKEID